MARTGHVSISRRFLDFTAHQDLQLTAGLDLDWPRAAKTATGSSRKIKAVGIFTTPVGSWQYQIIGIGFLCVLGLLGVVCVLLGNALLRTVCPADVRSSRASTSAVLMIHG